ncbi:metallo-beta-lactamase family protein [Brochothrix thermosphacta DSM 20171 = FSL F6-1036]|nr:metallo-beta-lactamase family protein [Brochothrix thermosphacta DSM 20171 = FSL F6-1036]
MEFITKAMPQAAKTSVADLRYSFLTSGSSGNATLIESDNQLLLIDCGHSGKKNGRALPISRTFFGRY